MFTKKDLAFAATDNVSAPANIAISDQSGTVAAIDEAGNATQLSFKEKSRSQSLRAQIGGLVYNGQPADVSGVQLAFAWFYGYTPSVPVSLSGLLSLPTVPAILSKSNTLTFLLQQAKLKDGSFIVALYTGKSTLILEYKNKQPSLHTIANLKPINFTTRSGLFSWSY